MDYAFYVNEGATMLGNDYLDQYIDDWTVTQPHKNINTPLFNRADNHNGYPLQGPEFLRFINGPAIHPTGPEYLPEGYLRHGLDPWVSCSSMSMQLKSPRFGMYTNAFSPDT